MSPTRETMSEPRSGLTTALKAGCFGCLGLAAVALAVAALLAGVAWYRARHEDPEKLAFIRTFGGAPNDAGTETGARPRPPAGGEAGTVLIDLSGTVFELRPAPEGAPLTVAADFDANAYELMERYRPAGEGEAGWTYEVTFRRTSRSYLITALKELISGTRPEVEVMLPRTLPFFLDLKVQAGGGEVELGGLWLTGAKIAFRQGGGSVAISEPLKEPIESLSLGFTQGGGSVEGVGNASPRRVDISLVMGGGDIDLRGDWQRDAAVSIEQRIGGASVYLPRNVEVRGAGGDGISSSASHEVPLPVVTITSSSRFGEIEFLR